MQRRPDRHPRDRLRAALSLRDATWLVVSSVIGSGIFLTPGVVADRLPHPGLFLGVWLLGAAISAAGAVANAELGAMLPRAGGDYVYLREAFHPAAGFLVGWFTFFAIYAGTVAALAAGFAEALGASLGLGAGATLALAVALVLAVSALNAIGVRWGALASSSTALLKVLALGAFIALGFALGEGPGSPQPSPPGALEAFSLPALGLALSPVLFTYLGWNASVYVASELRDPARNLPRSLFGGLALCAALYLGMNALYLYGLGIEGLRGVPNAGEAVAGALFGPLGGRIVGALVLLSILGTLNAMVLVGPRIAYAMALDGLFFRGLERTHARWATPTPAIALQAAAAVALLLGLRSFPSALDYTTFAILLATLADVAALYRLRRTRPELPRPYRAFGYPGVPAVYALAMAGIALALLLGRPWESAVSLAVLASGIPFYWLFARRTARRPSG